jgi:hypothetical protein
VSKQLPDIDAAEENIRMAFTQLGLAYPDLSKREIRQRFTARKYLSKALRNLGRHVDQKPAPDTEGEER